MRTITVKQEIIKLKESLNEKVYLSDLEEFKDNNIKILYNTIFNKAVTGIGGTSVALNSKENIIILMPFVEVVNNKDGYNEDTFIIKEGVTITAIYNYLKSNPTNRKIVSTYDGLKKIIEAYKKAKINIYGDFLLVDEWQVIFHQYGLRHDVMNILLEESTRFEHRCFMTATPINKEYWFKEFEGLEELNLIYDIAPVTLNHFNCRDIIDESIAIIKSKPENKNLHFFINSVETIKTIVNTLKLDSDLVRIICSKQDKNRYKLVGYKIESTKDEVKSINFYTSTCFEGCDIFDENGLIYVLCDGNRAHSLVDISTTLPQIAGRIRDISDNTVNLIYSKSRYIEVTEDEFKASTEKNIKDATTILNEAKSEVTIKSLDTFILNGMYLLVTDGKLYFEKILLDVDRFNFELSKTYSLKANIKAKTATIFNSIEVIKPWATQLEKDKQEKVDKLSFKEKCIMYNEFKKNMFTFSTSIIEFGKEVREAVDILGINRLEELNFHKGDVKKSLLSKMNIPDCAKIAKCLNFETGSFISSAELKIKFKQLYEKLKINKTAKATDILNYYEVRDDKEISKKIDGKVIKGYMIIRSKIVIKK